MPTLNKTYRLRDDVVRQMEALVAAGAARNQTALIEELVRREARRREREERHRRRAEEYRRAWTNPEYRAEQERIAREFWPLDLEAWNRADPA